MNIFSQKFSFDFGLRIFFLQLENPTQPVNPERRPLEPNQQTTDIIYLFLHFFFLPYLSFLYITFWWNSPIHPSTNNLLTKKKEAKKWSTIKKKKTELVNATRHLQHAHNCTCCAIYTSYSRFVHKYKFYKCIVFSFGVWSYSSCTALRKISVCTSKHLLILTTH